MIGLRPLFDLAAHVSAPQVTRPGRMAHDASSR
jgi:hypothetical protein